MLPAWNIGLFPEAERERLIEKTLALFFDGGAVPPPPGVRLGYGEELRMLAGLKRDPFPWQRANVIEAILEQEPETLVVDAGGVVERIGLVPSPSIATLPRIAEVLVTVRRDTWAQRGTLRAALETPGLLQKAIGRDMLTAYCAQRADLRGYHRMLAG